MTSRNTHWNIDLKPEPFLLKPAGKDYLWGGHRLKDEFAKELQMEPLAETWECSTHPEGKSLIASGAHQGKTLADVLREHPEYLGSHSKAQKELPILVKLIDAKKDLSIQVHPDDNYAKIHENGQSGKTEMWYVLDAAEDTHLVCGLYRDTKKETLKQSISDGTIEKYLQKVKIQKDEVYYIEAGTIHAIGAGALIAEIQENSDLTYRLYDYDRMDKHGQKRKLQVEKGLEAANLRGSPHPRQPMRVLRYRPGYASELLCRCKYFQVCRVIMNTERYRQMADYRTDCLSFRILLCTKGCGSIYMDNGKSICFFKGDCIFFPADSISVKLHGKAQFLDIRT